MANIRVDVDYTIADGAELLFYAPCDFADISGLKVYYPGVDSGIVSHEFSFKDAHKNDLSNLDNLFAEGACVKVILSVTNSTAYIQNADTNAYLEGRFDAIIDGTTQVGNAKTLDGHKAEYFATQEGLNKVQTTSGNTFVPNNKWYRVAERNGNSQIYNNSCFIGLKRDSSQSEVCLIRLEATNNKREFKVVSSKADNIRLITKIRYTYDASKTYIEAYCNMYQATSRYGFRVDMFDIANNGGVWNALPYVETEETVDGVTVLTTYDIPANASPVTDLDIAGLTTVQSGSYNIDTEPFVNGTYRTNANTTGTFPKNVADKLGVLWHINRDSASVVQVLFAHTTGAMNVRIKYSSGWSEWGSTLITKDGMISATHSLPLKLDTNTTYSLIQFLKDEKSRGYLGFKGGDNPIPCYINADWSAEYNLLHTGNKPSGSYNGNGSATKRTIQIGGTGKVLCIQSGYYLTFAYSEGAITFAVDTKTANYLTKEQVNFTDGVLTLETDSGFVNLSGLGYGWNVL